MTEHALQLRALVSASDASKTWDLRCRVREALVVFIQKGYAHGLPRQRASFENVVEDSLAAAKDPSCGTPG
jgi:hypothetical protein